MKALIVLAFTCMLLGGCSSSNNLLLGEVRATVGTHPVMVTDCYRTSVDAPRQTGAASYEYMPCRDARVTIQDEQLTVNGRSYGKLQARDSILVDHGVVSVHSN
ncbi:MAG: hypothetical protein P4L56_17775 [Candidatus Sulfopaludibacter sp.]|nr:hypothetical protein [Candidatus Sulfopaludibacter sp.]